MREFTSRQMHIIERLLEAGLRPIAIPPYESALCLRRGECAVVLAPVPEGGLRLLAPPSYLLEGNLSVRVRRGAGDAFVWKQKEVPVTAERAEELNRFRADVTSILEEAPPQ